MSPLDIASQGKLEANHLADNRVDMLDPAVSKRRLRHTQVRRHDRSSLFAHPVRRCVAAASREKVREAH